MLLIPFVNVLWNEYTDTLVEVATNRASKITHWNDIKDLLIGIWTKILIPILVVIWLLIAFVGFYKLMFSEKEDERKKWVNFVTWGTVWVVLMISAEFITNTLISRVFQTSTGWDYDPVIIANNLYSNIISKFFNLAMYLVIWILFIILLMNLIKFISNPDKDEIKKNTKTIIIWNTIWILLIISSKNIINSFYSKVKNSAISLWEQPPILWEKAFPWLYTILNYFLWFLAFAITMFIIYQAFQLLLKPEDESTYKNLKRYFVYSLIWIIIIWWVYLIANFFIIK